MKRIGMKLMAATLFCCGLMLTTVTVAVNAQTQPGKSKQKTVTLSEDVMVNDQLVKQGVYRVKFDAANSQIVISNDDGETVATAKVNVKMGERKAEHNSISSGQSPKGKVMTSLTFAGDRRIITLESSTNIEAGVQEQQ
jgi:hypothetical protein